MQEKKDPMKFCNYLLFHSMHSSQVLQKEVKDYQEAMKYGLKVCVKNAVHELQDLHIEIRAEMDIVKKAVKKLEK